MKEIMIFKVINYTHLIERWQQFHTNVWNWNYVTVKILKFGTPQTIAVIVLKIEKFDVTLH